MGKRLTLEGSNYHIRKAYLKAMKQFMADNKNSSQSPTNDEIEKYLQYEKQMSHWIQELLEHSDIKTTHN